MTVNSVEDSIGVATNGISWQPFDGVSLLRDVLVENLLKCRSFHMSSYDEYQLRQEADSLIPGDAVGLVLSIVVEADLALRSFTVERSPGIIR